MTILSALSRLTALAGCLILALGVSACGGDDTASEEDGTITEGPAGGEESVGELPSFDLTIGSLVSLTGAFSSFGPPLDKAANLAVEVANDAADEVGADITVSLESADTQTDPQASVSAARKLVGEGATCLTGTSITPDTIAITQSLTVAREIPLFVTAGSTAITTLDDNGTVFRTVSPDSLATIALANAIEDFLGEADGKTVSLAYRNEPYGEGLGTSFADEWESRGGEILGPVVFDPNQSSYNSEASEIVAGDEDVFLVIDYPDTYAKLGPALVRTGEFDAAKAFFSATMSLPEIPDTIPAEALEGGRVAVSSAPTDTPAAQAFDTLYTSAPGPDRFSFDSHNFDANVICFLAAVAAGSSDPAEIAEQITPVSGPPGEQYAFEQLSEAVAALSKGQDIDYDGVSGPIDFDENGDPTAGLYDLIEYENGKPVVQEQIAVSVGGS